MERPEAEAAPRSYELLRLLSLSLFFVNRTNGGHDRGQHHHACNEERGGRRSRFYWYRCLLDHPRRPSMRSSACVAFWSTPAYASP